MDASKAIDTDEWRFALRKQPSVTDPVKPDPVDILPSPSENLASPVPAWRICNLTRPVCGFPGPTFTYPAYTICVRLKKAKQRHDRKGQPGGKFADPVTFFSQNLPLGLLQRGVVKVTAICEEHNFFPPHFYQSSRRGEFRMSTHPKSWLINSQLQ